MSEEKRMEDGGLTELKHEAQPGFMTALWITVAIGIIYLLFSFRGVI